MVRRGGMSDSACPGGGTARSISRATTGGKLARKRVSCGVPSRETMAMFRRPPGVLALTALWLVTSPLPRGVRAQGTDSIPAERRAARQWFRDAKFGMFIHWGVYSLLGQGERVMQQRALPIGPYEWLATTFKPRKFDARAWVSLAKGAAAKCIPITSR